VVSRGIAILGVFGSTSSAAASTATERATAQQLPVAEAAGEHEHGSADASAVGSFFSQVAWSTPGPRDDAGVGGRGPDGIARGRLAVFGQIGFRQVALRLGIAIEGAQLHVLLVGGSRLVLELVEAGAERLDAGVGVADECAGEPFGLAADLPLEIGNLRAQFLDARVLVEQGRGLLGKLRAQRDALLGQPPQELGIGDVGEFARRAGAQRVADDAPFAGWAAAEVGRWSPSCWWRGRVVGTDQQVALGRCCSTLASASATLPRRM
jgi:hypothetical protein